MKICYLGDAGSVHVRKWAAAFAGRGHQVELISYRPGEIPGTRVHLLAEPPGRLPLWSVWRKSRRVRQLLNELKPDLVHAHYLTDYGWLAVWTGFHPLVVSAWGSDVARPLVSPAGLAARLALSRADAITVTSQFLAGRVRKFTARPPVFIPFGVDTELFAPAASGSKRKFTVGVIKNLEPIYGLKHLLRALPRVRAAVPELRTVIVGGGSQENELKALARSLGLEVEFAGRVSQDQLPGYLNQMDVFVMPSLAESFGVAALEAQSAGLPVVASRTGGIPEAVADGQTGLLVRPGDEAALADAIIRLYRDPAERQMMGQRGRVRVKKQFEWRDCVDAMEELYRNTLEGIR